MNAYARLRMPRLRAHVQNIARSRRTSKFYIGRTNDPQIRVNRHGSDWLETLYRTENIDNAAAVESALIRFFIRHPKCANRAVSGQGNVTSGWQYIYVAVWTQLRQRR